MQRLKCQTLIGYQQNLLLGIPVVYITWHIIPGIVVVVVVVVVVLTLTLVKNLESVVTQRC